MREKAGRGTHDGPQGPPLVRASFDQMNILINQ